MIGYTSKLVMIKNTVLDNIKLELSSNHFLNEFTKCVKKNNRSEYLIDIISRFTWIGYNDRNWLLKVSKPVPQQNTYISQRENAYKTDIVSKNELKILLSDMVRT